MSAPDLYLEESSFRIPKEHQQDAYAALKRFAEETPPIKNTYGDMIYPRPHSDYAAVSTVCYVGDSLADIFDRLGFVVRYDDPEEADGCNYGPQEDGDVDIVGIELVEEARDDEYDEILFPLVAPFVKSGSYLEFENEDSAHWKLFFQEVNGVVECRGVEPIITWPDPFQSEVKEDDGYHYPNAHTL